MVLLFKNYILSGIVLIVFMFNVSGVESADHWTIAGNDLYNTNSGNIGIGIDSPNYDLEVNGEIGTSRGLYYSFDRENDTYLGFKAGSISFYSNSSKLFEIKNQGKDRYVQIGDPENTRFIEFNYDALYIKEHGKRNPDAYVGIGTRTPKGLLHLKGYNSGIVFEPGGMGAGDTDFWVGIKKDDNFSDDDLFQIGDGKTIGVNPFFSIDTNGNIGIGTAPNALLDIAKKDNAYIRIHANALNKSAGIRYDKNGSSKWIIEVDVKDNFGFYNFETESYSMYINHSGNVGIGTIKPRGELDVRGNGSGMEGDLYVSNANQDTYIHLSSGKNNGVINPQINFSRGHDLIFTDGTTEYLRFKDGNLGIGTANPNSKLQIKDGDVYIQNTGRGIIMQDGSGQCRRVTLNGANLKVSVPFTCP